MTVTVVPAWGIDGLVLRAFRRFHDEPLIVEPTGTRTYDDVLADVERIAAALEPIDDPGRTVGILLPSGGDFVATMAATAITQWTRVALNTRDSTAKLHDRLWVTEASTLITTHRLVRELLGGPETLRARTQVRQILVVDELEKPPDDFDVRRRSSRGGFDARAVHLGTTGGTTGAPKAVLHTPDRVRSLIGHIWRELVDPRPGQVFLSLTPMSHASGAFVLPYLLRGAAIASLPAVDPAALREALAPGGWLAGYGVSTFLVPSAVEKLVSAYEADGVDAGGWFAGVVYGGSPAAPALVTRARAMFGECLTQLFGQAEVPMTVTVLRPEDHDRIGTRPGYCVGRPCELVDVWIERPDGQDAAPGEIGEVKVASDHVANGFLDGPGDAPRTAEFPLPLGDLGYLDDDGFLWLVGRSRDMVISGGFNVYPATVEDWVRRTCPVNDVIVAGALHPRWGEALVAGLRPAPGTDWDATVEHLEAAARTALAAYERPKGYLRIDAVPQTALGKPDRNAFLAEHAAQIDQLWRSPDVA